jgi:hypothetical protein
MIEPLLTLLDAITPYAVVALWLGIGVLLLGDLKP